MGRLSGHLALVTGGTRGIGRAIALTTTLAVEVAEHGIPANSVAPGFIDTELTRSVLDEQETTALATQVPLRRMGRPEEIADLVAWLCSPENSYITGQNILIDGGFTGV